MKLYQNAFFVPSIDKFFCSWSSHDFVGHKFEDGRELYYDGGLSYPRRVGNFEVLEDDNLATDFTLSDESSKNEIYGKLLILLRKDKYVPICELTKEHLFVIIMWFEKPNKYLPIVKEVAEYWYNKK